MPTGRRRSTAGPNSGDQRRPFSSADEQIWTEYGPAHGTKSEYELDTERSEHMSTAGRNAMIVVACLGVLSGLAYVIMPRGCCVGDIRHADTGSRVLRNAVSQWQLAENNYSHCPSVADLTRDRQLDAGQNVLDPWGNDYRISCSNEDVTVTSAGEDERFGTSDDISAVPFKGR